MGLTMMDVGVLVRRYRDALSLTQQGLADSLNSHFGRKYDRSRISRWEGGGERPPLDVQNHIRAHFDHRPLAKQGRAAIVAFSNFKGGVGKTTTTTNLAVVMAQRGHKVLLVDCDPQASASKYMLGEEGHLYAIQQERTLTDAVRLIHNDRVKAEDVLAPMIAANHGVDIIASSLRLARAEFRESGAEFLLKEMLHPLKSQYDWIFLDSPPNPGLPLSWVLTAATQLIIPVRTEPLDQSGLELILEEVQLIQRRLNSSLRIVGIQPNQYDARKYVDQLMLKALFAMDPRREEYEGGGVALRVFDPIAYESPFGRAALAEKPLVIEFPSCKGTQSFDRLATELVQTLTSNTDVTHGN